MRHITTTRQTCAATARASAPTCDVAANERRGAPRHEMSGASATGGAAVVRDTRAGGVLRRRERRIRERRRVAPPSSSEWASSWRSERAADHGRARRRPRASAPPTTDLDLTDLCGRGVAAKRRRVPVRLGEPELLLGRRHDRERGRERECLGGMSRGRGSWSRWWWGDGRGGGGGRGESGAVGSRESSEKNQYHDLLRRLSLAS